MLKLTRSVVIEGTNGAGKSYLANQLAEIYSVPILHAARPDNAVDAINESFRQHLWFEPLIMDRSHAISRLVYQYNILGDLERELLLVMARYLAASTTLIYCTGQGVRDTNKPHYNEALIKETKNQAPIIKHYKALMRELKHQEYNFEKNDISCLQLI